MKGVKMLILFTDTDTDMTPSLAKEYGYHLISMPYIIDDKVIYPYEDFEEFNYKEFYEMLRKGTIPKTCAVSPTKYIEYFEPFFRNGDDILYVHFSTKLSGTFNAMNIAIEELKETLRSNLQQLSERLEEQAQTQNNRLIRQIYDYIDQNYQYYDLSVNSISVTFQMSPAAVSKLFKRETNTGLLDYINQVRVRHARELLSTQAYSVSQVTEMVGYTNTSSFIRIFKKYEGISPGMVKQNTYNS